MLQAVAELEAQVDRLTKDQASRQQAQQRLEVEVARLKEGISKNRVTTPLSKEMYGDVSILTPNCQLCYHSYGCRANCSTLCAQHCHAILETV